MAQRPQPLFLLDQFQEFYREVQRLRDGVARGAWVFDPGAEGPPQHLEATAPAAGTATAAGSAAAAGAPTAGGGVTRALAAEGAAAATSSAAAPAPSAVWRSLVSLLERQALDAGRAGGDFASGLYRRAQYAMAALADEIFLHLDWPGREPWRQNLLEARLFGSHRAGEEVFARIEELLREHDAVLQELARLYLMVLALGFQGKYRGHPEAAREIEAYRRRLFHFVFGRDPRAVRGEERLVPQAYAATLDRGDGATLPHLRPWIWAFVVLLVLWIAGAHALWRREIADLEPVVAEILHGEPTAAAAERGARP